MWPRVDGGPGPARPVPFRGVSHRSPPAIHSSFSQPARPTACQCPTARRTVCTQKRSGSPSLPPSDHSALSFSLVHALSAFRRHPTRVTHSRSLSLSLISPAPIPSLFLCRLFLSLSRTVCTTAAFLRVPLCPVEVSPRPPLAVELHSANARAPAIVLSLSNFRRLALRLARPLSSPPPRPPPSRPSLFLPRV